MAQRVAGDQYFDLDGQLSEIKRQLRQPSGYPFDPARLQKHLQDAIEGCFGPAAAYSIASTFARDMAKEGWALLEDAGEPSSISIADLELVSFLKRGESYIGGEEMVKRAKKSGANLGQRHAEFLLEHQDEIPAKYRKHYLVFPGTIWRFRDGGRLVPYLCWDGGRWELVFGWLGRGWDSSARLPRSSK